MAYRLPPLNTLRLFEAAGRHQSFKAAAEELHLTPSAVSHGIQTLEDWLGVELFLRGNRSLSLTPAGQTYLPRVRDALQSLALATESVPGRAPSGRLSVSAAPTFALRWLIPRLPAFQERHPAITVALDTAHRVVEFPRDGIDVGIRLGRGDWPGLAALKLMEEDLVPVAAPALAARIACPADLATVPLLHVADVSEDWTAWAEAAGLPPSALDDGLKRGLRLDAIHMAVDAAVRGLGVIIGRRPTIDPELASGQLVEVMGPRLRAKSAYWLVTAQDSLRRPEVAAFRSWMRAEFAQGR
ncbi:LysR family transcriptional regulator [Azospirillum baldaniorum]|uniref:Transcriptional Regulator, LysR family putative Glycine cleavage system transcriptional activator (Gcv operon activator) n=1 Tax=Azospirillum baldaniorum TaxID=1064539 RepID=A0A9P1JMR7_9PROT|nr:transcriptional regulator GcvA [Azospirillum baldaniorum]AWJ88689.1 LysR family transcriptional regulator [Azospirillum baldaniorum]TWA79774.1 DNA-binding transcriptional LysR family regulator [Azospirillum brasilense]CCC96338.1 transcriptional Regulator, LysR family; putative Glycine cleavage system transcriptional activator (Gcv operon activator) [Azospirillum baldaniorum]